MEFGFIIPHNFGLDSPEDVVDVAVAAETGGFDSVWVNHHVLHAGYVLDRLDDKPYYDALTVLTYVAAKTNSVKLGTTVLVLPYLNPLVLAKTIATLDVMSGGRMIVGVGVGSLPEESEALGSDYATRVRYANESIEVMKELWTNPLPNYNGSYYSFSGVKFSPKPQQQPHPPILVGGQSMPAMRRAVVHGDGWHPIGLSPKKMAERLKVINQLLDQYDRNSKNFRISLRSELNVTDVDDCDNSPTVGTPDRLIEIISEYEQMGVTEMVFSVSTDDVPYIHSMIEKFSKKILSVLRK